MKQLVSLSGHKHVESNKAVPCKLAFIVFLLKTDATEEKNESLSLFVEPQKEIPLQELLTQ